MTSSPCLILMFKAPQRSKQRLAAQIGAGARIAAEHLLECAVEDLAAWPGPVCLAPAAEADARYARRQAYSADIWAMQGTGNLGERIRRVNADLLRRGHQAQIFIGIDCPALDADYLHRAAAALDKTTVVLGPAHDGGVVLMGVRGAWPPLAELPWSSPELGRALQLACARRNLSVALLEAHPDVDDLEDLRLLPEKLSGDERASRRRLREWISAESFA